MSNENQQNQNHAGGNGGQNSNGELVVHIDNKPFKAPSAQMTGAQLKNLAGIDIQKYNLFLEIPGAENDPEIKDDQIVDLKPGMHFQSALKFINPGSNA